MVYRWSKMLFTWEKETVFVDIFRIKLSASVVDTILHAIHIISTFASECWLKEGLDLHGTSLMIMNYTYSLRVSQCSSYKNTDEKITPVEAETFSVLITCVESLSKGRNRQSEVLERVQKYTHWKSGKLQSPITYYFLYLCKEEECMCIGLPLSCFWYQWVQCLLLLLLTL